MEKLPESGACGSRDARTGATEHYEEKSDPEIRLFKLNEVDADYEQNHSRVPDLSAEIRVVFPSEEYTGVYLSHGGSQTVFVIRSSNRQEGRFDGAVLKIKHGHDVEPAVMRQIQDATPKLVYECIGKDGDDRYHC